MCRAAGVKVVQLGEWLAGWGLVLLEDGEAAAVDLGVGEIDFIWTLVAWISGAECVGQTEVEEE